MSCKNSFKNSRRHTPCAEPAHGVCGLLFRCTGCLGFVLLIGLAIGPRAAGAEMPADEAWQALPKYEHGQDMAPLLAIDREVIQAMASGSSRSACAARLAALLEAADTTPAARQYVCLQLRQVGTPAQVPLLVRLLTSAEMADSARQTLQAIPGEESAAAMRTALGTLRGTLLLGAVNSVGVRRDGQAVAKLQELAVGADQPVAEAALRALGNIANDPAAAFLAARAEQTPAPLPQTLAVALLRSADASAAAGSVERAQAIYTTLSQPGQAVGIRRAAAGGLFRLQKDPAATVLAWMAAPDAERRRIAAGHLACLSDKQLDQLGARLVELPEESRTVVLEALALRQGADRLSLMLKAAQSDKPELRVVGIRGLGALADSSTLPFLLDRLADGGEVTKAAQEALCRLPRKAVTEELLAVLEKRAELRAAAIEVLARLRCYEAIDPLVVLAADKEPGVYEVALEGLQRIADPDEHDIPRLVALLRKVAPGRHRDEVEKAILLVCDKQPAGADRAGPVLAALAKVPAAEKPKCLPLLGRLGGAKAYQVVETALGQADPEVKQAAVRALCNWPNAEVAGKLWELASRGDDAGTRRSALRAYVRVVTLKSDRPEAETLGMLQQAMKQAQNAEDKQLVLVRASTVRTLETVTWVAGYLDHPELAQAACESIVELAHHRFLRHPNMDRFGPLLDKVSKLSRDPAIVERAKKYRLGL